MPAMSTIEKWRDDRAEQQAHIARIEADMEASNQRLEAIFNSIPKEHDELIEENERLQHELELSQAREGALKDVLRGMAR